MRRNRGQFGKLHRAVKDHESVQLQASEILASEHGVRHADGDRTDLCPRCMEQRPYKFRWKHGPAPGLTYYDGTETAYGHTEEQAKARALRAICQRGCFQPGCITLTRIP